MKKILLALSIIGFSCCPPAKKVMDGTAPARWERKHEFRATYQKYGSLYVIRYENKQTMMKEIINCRPPFKSGTWITR